MIAPGDVAVLVQEIISQARRLGLVWTLRFATVTNGDRASNMSVTFDGDTSSDGGLGLGGSAGVTSLIGRIAPGTRVAVVYVPPAGQYIIGKISSPGYIIEVGSVGITPIANTATSVAVTFRQRFTSVPIITVTPLTSVPGSAVLETSASNPTVTGFNAVIYRTNTTPTSVNWMAIQMLS